MLKTIYKEGGVFKYPKVFQCDNGSEFKRDVTKLLEKHNADNRRATQNTRVGKTVVQGHRCSRASGP